MVRTAAHDRALNRDHEIIRTFTIPGESQGTGLVFWYELGDRQALAEFHQRGGPRATRTSRRARFTGSRQTVRSGTRPISACRAAC